MNYPRILALLTVLTLCSSFGFAEDRTIGPFSSEIGQLRFLLTDGTASSAGSLNVQIEADARKKLWSTIYSAKSDDVIYIVPLSPTASSFLVTEGLGSGFKVVILRVESLKSVVTELDTDGKDFPELIRSGIEDTQFVIVRNASKVGDVLDVADIYALEDGAFKRVERVQYGLKLVAVERMSHKIDQTAAERRKGVVVHP